MNGERPAASGERPVENGRASGVDVNPGRYWPLAARRSPLALLTLFAVLVVPALFARDLWDPDEPRFAQIGREMLRSGDWVIPRMNGEPLALLPPLHDWVSATVGLPSGDVSPAASRAGAALGGAIALLSIGWLAARWWGPGVAFWTCVVLLTSVRFWLQASYAQVDLLLAGLVTASIVAFRVAWEEGDKGLRAFLAGCALAALGTLTKGPVAAVCPGLVFAVLALAERRRGFLRPAWLAGGAAVYLGIVSPWYLLACHRGGAVFAHELLVTHNFGMFFETWSHHQPPWYYLRELPWMLAPWIVFLPAAYLDGREALRPSAPTMLRALFRPESPDPAAARHRFAWLWFLALFAFFSISQAKQTKYLLPAFPAAALVLGRLLDKYASGQGRGLRAALTVLAGVAVLVLSVAVAACVLPSASWPLVGEYSEEAGTFAVPGLLAALALALWIPSPWLAARRPCLALGCAAGGISLAFLVVTFVVFPRVDRLKSARPLCDRIRPGMLAGDEVGIYGIQERKIGAFRYYLDRPLRTFEDPTTEHPDFAALAAWWRQPGKRWLVVDEDHLTAFPIDLRQTMGVVDSVGVGHRRVNVVARRRLEFRVDPAGKWRQGAAVVERAAILTAMRAGLPAGEREDDGMTVVIAAQDDSPSATVFDLIELGAEAGISHFEFSIGPRLCTIVLPKDMGHIGGITWEARVELCASDVEAHRADRMKHMKGCRGQAPGPRTVGWIEDEADPPRDLRNAEALDALARQAVERAKRKPEDRGDAEVLLEIDPNVPAGRFLDLWQALEGAGWPNPHLASSAE